MVKFQNIKSPHVRESGFRNPGNLAVVQSEMLGFGIRNTAHRIRNPSSHDEKSGIQYPEYRIQGMGSRIQDCRRALTWGDTLLCYTSHL